MRVWRVQFAYGLKVYCPTVQQGETRAKAEVVRWFDDYLIPALKASVRINEDLRQHLEYVADGKATIEELLRRIANGDTWGAYDLWHDFLDRHEGTWSYPMWVKLGTVLVDTREDEPARKMRLMPATDVPPITRYDPGEGLVMGPGEFWGDPKIMEIMKRYGAPPSPGAPPPPTMGARNVWEVQYAEGGTAQHPSTYTDEERAKEQVAGLLVWIINKVQRAIPEMQEAGADPDFLREAFDAVMLTGIDLDVRDVWSAYETWRKFEDQHGARIDPPVGFAFGTVRARKR